MAIDGFTEYASLRAVRNTEAGPVLKFFDEIFSMFGVTQRVLCDKGRCSIRKLFDENYNAVGIEVNYNATATPRTNDRAEGFCLVEGSASGRLVRRILRLYCCLFAVFCCWLIAVLAAGCCRAAVLAV
jgi:hypothetical protein